MQQRLAREALDNPLERGVNDMMYGRLEGKGDEEIWEDIPAPEFADQPADELTDGLLLLLNKIAHTYIILC